MYKFFPNTVLCIIFMYIYIHYTQIYILIFIMYIKLYSKFNVKDHYRNIKPCAQLSIKTSYINMPAQLIVSCDLSKFTQRTRKLLGKCFYTYTDSGTVSLKNSIYIDKCRQPILYNIFSRLLPFSDGSLWFLYESYLLSLRHDILVILKTDGTFGYIG